MAVTKAKKAEILEQLKALLKDSKSVGFTSSTGLTVDDITSLRVSLREANSTITLAKKTLIKIAFKEVYDAEINDDLLPGQIAIVCSDEDAVAGLGKVNGFMKKGQPGEDKIEWTGSYIDGEFQDADATKKLAGMPSRETLLGRLVGSMQSPLSGLARFFDAAAKEVEAQGKTKVSELEADAPAAKVEEKIETPKEEVKAEEKTEAPAEKAEAPKEEAKTEDAPAEKTEAPKEEAAPVKEETKTEEK